MAILTFRAYGNSQADDAYGYVSGFASQEQADHWCGYVIRKHGAEAARVSTESSMVLTSSHEPIVVNVRRHVFKESALCYRAGSWGEVAEITRPMGFPA